LLLRASFKNLRALLEKISLFFASIFASSNFSISAILFLINSSLCHGSWFSFCNSAILSSACFVNSAIFALAILGVFMDQSL